MFFYSRPLYASSSSFVYPAARQQRNDMTKDLGVVGLRVFVAAFMLFMIAPILVVVVVSFSSQGFVSFPVRSFSLRWYYRIIEYRPFVDSLIVSLELAFL